MEHFKISVLWAFAGWVNREQQDVINFLLEENKVWRELHGGKGPRLNDKQRKRLAVKGKLLCPKVREEFCCIVTPETLLGWHRKLVAQKYDGSKNRGPGRPRKSKEIAETVVRMAKENPGWGYTRLMGAMENLGHTIGRRTVKRILEDHGIRPAYDRSREGSWSAFLKAHWESLAATDFFTVEIWTSKGLVRYFVLLVIEYHTRRVHIAGISPEPNGAWVEQLGRNLVDPYDGFLKGKKFLIHDRDPLFTARFRETLKSVGCQCIRLPKRSPNLNAYAERFVRSIKYECLNKMILFGESHLGHVVKEYVTHYNAERNHQGMENRLLSTNGPRGEIHQEKLFVKRGWGEC